MHDTPAGFQVVIHDLTTGQSGSMTASVANGFGHAMFEPDASTCTDGQPTPSTRSSAPRPRQTCTLGRAHVQRRHTRTRSATSSTATRSTSTAETAQPGAVSIRRLDARRHVLLPVPTERSDGGDARNAHGVHPGRRRLRRPVVRGHGVAGWPRCGREQSLDPDSLPEPDLHARADSLASACN